MSDMDKDNLWSLEDFPHPTGLVSTLLFAGILVDEIYKRKMADSLPWTLMDRYFLPRPISFLRDIFNKSGDKKSQV